MRVLHSFDEMFAEQQLRQLRALAQRQLKRGQTSRRAPRINDQPDLETRNLTHH
jgi:hypothetical protein